jgi:mannose-1-phosphate guanylyltransferase
MNAMLPTMILSAGLGTRLRPLTDEVPKPMVPVGDKPAIEHIRAHLVRHGCTQIALNAFHLPRMLADYARAHGLGVSEEATLLGTAGGVRAAREHLGHGDVLVWNGDILAEPELLLGMRSHAASGAQATLWVRDVAHGGTIVAKPGNVGFAADGRIVRLRQESFGEEAHAGEFAGIHILGAALREVLPEAGCLVGDVYLPALRRGAHLFAERLEGFSDIGSVRAYAEANFAWLTRQGTPSYLHSSASLHEHGELQSSIVGAGAQVLAPLQRCIVWPNTRVDGPGYDCIVTPKNRVPFLD